MSGQNTYRAKWDGFTWLILVIVVAACAWPVALGDIVVPVVLTVVFAGIVLAAFLGTYYRVEGSQLIVYSFFKPTAYPIGKIAEIKPTKSVLAAPATSLTDRIAIKFSDRNVMKSSSPLIISPVRQKEFIARLLAINPEIKV